MPYRSVDVLAIQPRSPGRGGAGAPARAAGEGAARAGGAGVDSRPRRALASYLLFEPGFVQTLIAAGERDAFARKQELLAFMGHATA